MPSPPGTSGNTLPQCSCVGRPTVPQEGRSGLDSTLAGTGRKRRLEIFPTGGRGGSVRMGDRKEGRSQSARFIRKGHGTYNGETSNAID